MPETEMCEPFTVSSPRLHRILCVGFYSFCSHFYVCVPVCVCLQIVPDLAYTAVVIEGVRYVRTYVLYADNSNNNTNNNTTLDQQHH